MPPAKLRLLMIAENANDGMSRQVRLVSSIGRKELASGCAIFGALFCANHAIEGGMSRTRRQSLRDYGIKP
jgi:hypothetical protein